MGLSLLFAYGMWYGIVYRRWGTLGMLAFIAVQVLVALAYSWSGLGGHLASLSALDLTGVIAALTVVFWPAATPRSAAPRYERARPLIPLAPFAFVLLRR